MEITEEKNENGTIFRISGRLDTATSPEVEKKIIATIESGVRNIVLNFSDLEYISSAGIRVLVHCHKKIEHVKGKVVLCSLPKPVENVLYITGFLPYFKIFESSEEALNSLGA